MATRDPTTPAAASASASLVELDVSVLLGMASKEYSYATGFYFSFVVIRYVYVSSVVLKHA